MYDAIARGLTASQRSQLAIWLGACTGWVSTLIILGGITRLTRSGLSMTDWKFTGKLSSRSHQTSFLVAFARMGHVYHPMQHVQVLKSDSNMIFSCPSVGAWRFAVGSDCGQLCRGAAALVSARLGCRIFEVPGEPRIQTCKLNHDS